jgi:hypothetical protein
MLTREARTLYRLTTEQVGFYREQGYLLVEGLLSRAEAEELRRECHALAERLATRQKGDPTWGSARELMGVPQETKLVHCHNVQFQSAAFTRLLLDERLTGATADLIGSPSVQLHHNKIFRPQYATGGPLVV